ncbi:MAG: DUF1924 domain-containing protein [Rhodocyclaceae bacterium]|nr:DUF1924 domain-containing protein [Rhodocyclaceae bacterium]
MKSIFPSLALALAWSAQAATPAQLMSGYAAAAGAGFKAEAARGAEFYKRNFGVSAKMPSCTSCHTEHPSQPGRHVVTDKPIKPLAPAANPERFTDPAKVEKWFKRNCSEVVGRECTAAEKADFIAFITGGH